jgi:hypothetical protein
MLQSLRCLCLVALAALIASGCQTTHAVRRSDPAALAQMTERLAGRAVTISLADTSEHGRFIIAALDSTRWRVGASIRSVPTSTIRTVTYDVRRRNALTGLIVGGTLFGGLSAAGGSELCEGADCYAILIPAAIVAGGLLIGSYGYVGSPPEVYRLTE